jgi:hypothetical protein
MLFDAKRARPLRSLPAPRLRNGALSDLHTTARHRSYATLVSAAPSTSRQINRPLHPFLDVTYDPGRELGPTSAHQPPLGDPSRPLSPDLLDPGVVMAAREHSGHAVARRMASPPFPPSRLRMDGDSSATVSPRSPSRVWLDEYHHIASRQPQSYTAIIDDIMGGSLGSPGPSEPISRRYTRRARENSGEGDTEGRRVRQRLRDVQSESDRGRSSHPWRDSRRDGLVFEDSLNHLPLSLLPDASTPPAGWFVDGTRDHDASHGQYSLTDDHTLSLDAQGYMTYVPWNDEGDSSTII